jgi:hypothetical protein
MPSETVARTSMSDDFVQGSEPGRRRGATRALAIGAGAMLVAGALATLWLFGWRAQPTERIQEWDIDGFPEPSGLVYHPGRATLFVVGDEGDIGEVSGDGRLLRRAELTGDLEGITVDPVSGRLYVIREGHEVIYEVDAETLEITRRFSIDRTFEGDPNYLRRGGDGIEGLTYVSLPEDPEGGRFFAVNQYDPAVLLELVVPLRSSAERFETARIVSAREVSRPPLSGVMWSPAHGGFLIVSALWRQVYVTDALGVFLRAVRIPGLMPEGLERLPDGSWVIAQDTGGLVHWIPGSDPFAADAAAVATPAPASLPDEETEDLGNEEATH